MQESKQLELIVNEFALNNGLIVEKTGDWENNTELDLHGINKLYSLKKKDNEGNIDKKVGIWLARGENEENFISIHFVDREKLTDLIYNGLFRRIEKEIPTIDILITDAEKPIIIGDTSDGKRITRSIMAGVPSDGD